MLTKEMKRKVFMKLRSENYRASLRLEGLDPRTDVGNKLDSKQAGAALKTKNGR